MANEQASTLSFSIQEAVWLNRGQEIDSVMSLELEPEIAIEEAEEHVTVKGNLVLTGEYRPGKEVDATQQQRNASLSEQVSFRSIDEVRISEEGHGEIRHPFPIDVTIPRSRISNLDEVYVNVESFDYDLPGNGCIELQADLAITGMRGEFNAPANEDSEENRDEEEEEEEEYVEKVVTEDDLDGDRTFHFEGFRPPEWQQPPQQEAEEVEPAVRSEPAAEEQKISNGTSEKQAWQSPSYEQQEEQQEPLSAVSGNEQPHAYDQASSEEEEEPAEDLYAMRYEEETFGQEEEEEYEEYEEPAEEQPRDENALYLTKVLANNDEGEEFSRLRMCIVQAGESIETIANRYKLQVSHLMRTNNLNEERVEEGQILYIPTRKTSSASS
ncbi:stage VI sporulation protein D [Alteribacter natronophilus]|uniref:stage VI sporulation protein D n=1 Tax=Alteribacter natronophilus TaxID=2583810 RepID=UPI00110F22F1|nr:stage VI sporulation protein D [Alteribacter natronophilus]TMW71608.1 stage VI sporulation protein D [Alteribacter natronophilus]